MTTRVILADRHNKELLYIHKASFPVNKSRLKSELAKYTSMFAVHDKQ